MRCGWLFSFLFRVCWAYTCKTEICFSHRWSIPTWPNGWTHAAFSVTLWEVSAYTSIFAALQTVESMTVGCSYTNRQTHRPIQNTHICTDSATALQSFHIWSFHFALLEGFMCGSVWQWAQAPLCSLLSSCQSPHLRPIPAGACGRPEGSPGAVSRGWTLSPCQLMSFCACDPRAPVPEAPGNGPARATATAPSATDLP